MPDLFLGIRQTSKAGTELMVGLVLLLRYNINVYMYTYVIKLVMFTVFALHVYVYSVHVYSCV